MDKTLVEIDGLRLDYGAVCAVKDVSFHMKAGEILAVIGPNGSGKTSTVECVEGLRRPTSGSVQVFGVNPLKNRSQVYREMGIQLQEAEYPDKIKVKELCGLFASFYENPADWHLLLKQLGLEEKDKKRIVMIGNNLKKDIAGANRFGITSIWLDWSPRYYRTIEEEDWRPDYTVHHPSELPALLEELNRKLEDKAPGR